MNNSSDAGIDNLEYLLAPGTWAEVLRICDETEPGKERDSFRDEFAQVVWKDVRIVIDQRGDEDAAYPFLASLVPVQMRVYAGITCYRLNQLRQAIRHYEACIEGGGDEATCQFNIGLALFDLGTELFESGERRESLRFLHRARKIMRSPQPSHASAEKTKLSLEIIDLYLAGDEKEDARKRPPTILEQLDEAQVYCDDRGYTTAIRKYRAALNQLESSQHSELARARAGLAVALLKGDTAIDRAMVECEAARALCAKTDDLDCQSYVLWCHALVHFRAGYIDQALRLYQEALALAQQTRHTKTMRACLRAIGNCYRANNDEETALVYDEKAANLNDS